MHCNRIAAFFGEGDPYDIEAKFAPGSSTFLKIASGGTYYLTLLSCVHSFKRVAVLLSCSRSHLNEDENSLVFCHQINLTLGPSPIVFQDAKATLLKQASRQLLGSGSKRLSIGELRCDQSLWPSSLLTLI